MLSKAIYKRMLPDLLAGTNAIHWASRREELLAILSNEVYGVTPPFTTELYSFIESEDVEALGGKAVKKWIRLSFMTPQGMYSFPFRLTIPKKRERPAVFVHLTFQQTVQAALSPSALDEYLPYEEVIDAGYAIADLFYEDVTSDTAKQDGLARAYSKEETKDWGKIGMWAFAASRVLDYLLSQENIDSQRIAIGGWSRLGKAALWCGAQDERFSLVISTESGCGGAALQRGKTGETVYDITQRFGYWFSPNYKKYATKENTAPFDQHFLLACIAPRHLFIGSAQNDAWADPLSEFLSAVAASPAYHLLGEKGLVSSNASPLVAQELFEGNIGYFMRPGHHAMSRTDWLAHMRYRDLHTV